MYDMCAYTCTYLLTSDPSKLGMGNIDVLVYNYCEAKHHDYHGY